MMKKASYLLMVLFGFCGVFLAGYATFALANNELLVTASVDDEVAIETEPSDSEDYGTTENPSEDADYDDSQDEGHYNQTGDYDVPDAGQYENSEDNPIGIY